MTAVIAVGLAAVAAWYVLAPLRGGRRGAAGGASAERAGLVRERETALHSLRDLALDHATGKMSDADYDALRSRQEIVAIDALRRLDALDQLASRPATREARAE
ncbi:MAG TPA: hypothetical protein VJT33_13805 [bacterium]|nr:hypothetical protein [bacterium]